MLCLIKKCRKNRKNSNTKIGNKDFEFVARFQWGNPTNTDHLEDLGIDGMIVLNCSLEK
jgi:hypothetical protein